MGSYKIRNIQVLIYVYSPDKDRDVVRSENFYWVVEENWATSVFVDTIRFFARHFINTSTRKPIRSTIRPNCYSDITVDYGGKEKKPRPKASETS